MRDFCFLPPPKNFWAARLARSSDDCDFFLSLSDAPRRRPSKGASAKLVHQAPEDYTKMETAQTQALIEWLNNNNDDDDRGSGSSAAA